MTDRPIAITAVSYKNQDGKESKIYGNEGKRGSWIEFNLKQKVVKVESIYTTQSLKVMRFHYENGSIIEIQNKLGENDKTVVKNIELKNDQRIIGIWGSYFNSFAEGKLSKFGLIISSP